MTAINSNRAIRGPVTAVPVVAGHGVRLVSDTVNNRIVAEADETVLWSGEGTSDSFPITLSEALTNFEKVEFYWTPRYSGDYGCPTLVNTLSTDFHGGNAKYTISGEYWNDNKPWIGMLFLNQASTTSLAFEEARYIWLTNNGVASTGLNFRLWKIVGINRISGGE